MNLMRGLGVTLAFGLSLAIAWAADTKPGEKPTPLVVDMGLPLVRSWVPPVCPKEAIDQKLDGRVQVRVVIDETGMVTKVRAIRSSKKMFEDAALESVRQWKFGPAVSDGRAVSACVDITLPIRRADFKDGKAPRNPPAEVIRSVAYSPRAPAARTGGGDPDYPNALLSRHLPGAVVVTFTVNPQGGIQALKILGATHADFVQPALAAAEKWTFRPARQGDLAVEAPFEASLEFTVVEEEGKAADVLASNGVTLAKDQSNDIETRPHLNMLADPVYPYDLLLAGTEGTAVVDFVIGPGGRVGSIAVREASQEAFGQALAAALDGWVFDPALRSDGLPFAVKASLRWSFSLAPDSALFQGMSRLLKRIRTNDTADLGAKGLDGRLNPRYRVPPLYPARLLSEKPSGEATIQFIVDRDGRCRMAKIVSATREEFGWAAATAVEQWVFDPPRRGGEPADVRVSIPFKFSPPD
jgi:TonB family protein